MVRALLIIFIFVFFVTILVVKTVGGFDMPDDSKQALHNAGYSNVELKGHKIFGCDQHDISSISFTATNPAGKNVDGVVCCGITKGCTIRF